MWKSYIYSELSFEFTRSRGAGGQHVNKTESAVYLRWPLNDTQLFDPEQKLLLKQKLRNQLNQENEVVIRSEKFRDRDMNKKDAISKFIALIEQALHKPKARKKTKPTRSSQKRRLESKKIQSVHKSNRQKVRY